MSCLAPTPTTFGNEADPSDADPNQFRYCWEYYDTETGTYYLRARYYDPSLGRFGTEDPAHDGLNWYTYCGGNPVAFIDPSGCILQEEIDMYQRGELSKDVYLILVDLGKRWEAMQTQEGKDEVHNLAESFRKNNYQYEDYTYTIDTHLKENVEYLFSYFDDCNLMECVSGYAHAGLDWFKKVKPNGDWDYKAISVDWMNQDYFLYNSELISKSDLGNINYGYTGNALSLSDVTLYKGGGIAAEMSGTPTQFDIDNFYSDSELDHYWIKYGIELYGAEGKIKLPVKLLIKIFY